MTDTTTTTQTRLVVFTNPDYTPCRRMMADLDQLVAGLTDVEVEYVDVWQNADRAIDSEVMTLPMTIISVNGVERERIAGARSRRSLRRAIERAQAPSVAATTLPAPALA